MRLQLVSVLRQEFVDPVLFHRVIVLSIMSLDNRVRQSFDLSMSWGKATVCRLLDEVNKNSLFRWLDLLSLCSKLSSRSPATKTTRESALCNTVGCCDATHTSTQDARLGSQLERQWWLCCVCFGFLHGSMLHYILDMSFLELFDFLRESMEDYSRL